MGVFSNFGGGLIGNILGTNSGTNKWNANVSSASLLTTEQQEYLKKVLPQLFGATTGDNPALEGLLGNTRASAENTWSTKTLPQIMASAGTLHSGSTANRTMQGYNDMQMGLSGNESNMRYGSQQNAMQQLLAALGITGKENIVDKPGMIEGLLGGGLF
jgi:hypothetical protein